MKLNVDKIVEILENMPLPSMKPKRKLDSKINYLNNMGNKTVREHLTKFYKEITKNIDNYDNVKDDYKLIFKTLKPGRYVELMLAIEDKYFTQIMQCWE
tara:strand:- start:697 stop:993 length:297 start_codon:yes stop_codon:yes gene_type:complete